MPERKDFQVQVSDRKQAEPIATQTDSSTKCDFQSQANITRESVSIALQTIKEEVAMPNIPNSAPQIPAKKRKLSSTSSASSRNLDRPTQATRKSSRKQLADVESGDHVKNLQDAVDEKILNSEIYKIYCRNEDPKEAIKQIRELKTCIYFEQSTAEALAEDKLKRESEKTLSKILKLKTADDSKFIKITQYVNCGNGYVLNKVNENLYYAFKYRFTKIKMLLPNGYEFWHVSNIEGGPGLSKWYRAESTSLNGVVLLAQLNVMGITESVIQKLQYNLERETRKIQWSHFAFGVLKGNEKSLFPSYTCPSFAFEFFEEKTRTTKIVKASLQLTHLVGSSRSQESFKTYHGKSTRPLKNAGRPKEEIEEMKQEAKKAVLMEFFKERFGFTEFNDLYVDELHRSIGI